MNRLLLLFTAVIFLFTNCSPKESIEHITISPDSTVGYTAIVNNKTPKAYILLFPGFGESSDDVLAATDPLLIWLVKILPCLSPYFKMGVKPTALVMKVKNALQK